MSNPREHRSFLQFFTIFFILTLALLAQPTHADYQAGLDAYNNGNYPTAMNEWLAVTQTPPATLSPATYAETYYAIGMLYWMGQGIPASYFEAFKWLQKAADLDHPGAQGKLGYLYTEGITVPQNYEVAFQWFSKAAKQGDVDGLYNLGIFYLNGWGTEQDKTMAAQYLAAASTKGDEAAEVALQGLLPPRQTLSQTVSPKATQTKTSNEHAQSQSIVQPSSWILAQDPNHYTIQVIALRSKPALKKLIHGYDRLAPFAIYTLERDNRSLNLLLQGVYPDVESAREAKEKLSTAIEKPENIWIRKFGKIQDLIRQEAISN